MEWTKDLAVGIETIDEQHKELFKRINGLLVAIKEHRCRSEIDGTLAFLEDYAKFHFNEEENRMRAAGYPGFKEHVVLHREYMKSLAELKEMASQPRVHGASYDLSVTTNQVVVDWIVDHIMKADRKFGEHVKGGRQ